MTQNVHLKEIFSTHDAARICRVTPMTVIRWIKEGKIPAFKTAGGHRRILYADLCRFCAARGIPLAEGDRKEAGRVLIADADPATREVIADAVRAVDGRLALELAGDAFAAGKLLAEFRPGLLFLDHRLPGVDANDLCARLARDPDEPIGVAIVLGSHSPDAERAFKARGALGCIGKPPSPALVERLVRQAFKLPAAPRAPTVYIVDRDLRAARTLRRALEQEAPGCRVSLFTSLVDVLLMLASDPPDGLVVDSATLDLSPLEVVKSIVATGSTVLAVGARHDGQAAAVLGAGARAFLTKPCGAEEVLANLKGVTKRREAKSR